MSWKIVAATSLISLSTQPVSAMDKRQPSDISKYAGKTITVRGAISNVIWQHMLEWPDDYKYATYVDIGKIQTVVYSRDKINCKNEVEVTGRVFEVKSQAEVKMGKTTKLGADYTEYHIAADNWRCLPDRH